MTALVPGDPVKAQVLASIYSLKSYTYAEYHELLASGEIDAVYVATPNFLHAQYVLPALSAGIHVLLEKPMATTEAECREMANVAERTGAKLMVAYRLHCEPGTLEMIERVKGASSVTLGCSPRPSRKSSKPATTATKMVSPLAPWRTWGLTLRTW